MKVVFVSNYLSHHQIPFSDEMYAITDGEYRFVQMEEMDEERKNMGWMIDETRYSYLLKYSSEPKKIQKLIDSADAVIVSGSVPYQYTGDRVKSGNLLIKYEERPFKHSDHVYLFKPRMLRMMLKCHRSCRDKNVYLLCAGAYVSKDMERFGAYPKKMYAWGYFPAFFDYGESGPEKERDNKIRILWCARLIPWKRPMMAVELADFLKKKGVDFTLTMIGNGSLAKEVSEEINSRDLSEYIEMIDFVPYYDMQQYYLKSDIFFMTSDRNEGWGAVLNEAMNHGCICVADRKEGAAPWLIKDGENGFLYDTPAEAYDNVLRLCKSDDEMIRNLQGKAYITIKNCWSPKLAAERIMTFLRDPKGFIPPKDGIMSKI